MPLDSQQFPRDPENDCDLDPADYDAAEHESTIAEELEVRDYYVEENVFWVPALARWNTIQESAPLGSGTEKIVCTFHEWKRGPILSDEVSGKALAAGSCDGGFSRCATNPRLAPCGSQDPELFLDYMRYFVLFEDDCDSLIQKIAGYHQFHGVREAVRVATIAAADSDDDEVRERTGDYRIESRKQGQPAASAMPLTRMQTTEQANSREELRDMLASSESGGIIFTTVQKFSLLDDEDEHPRLRDRSNVVVISDEAHRSQYGLEARLIL